MKELLKPMCGLLVFITLIFMMIFSLIGVCYSFDFFIRDRQQRARMEIKQNVFPPAVIDGVQRTVDYKYDDKIYHHDVIFYNLEDKGVAILHLPECKYCKEEQGK